MKICIIGAGINGVHTALQVQNEFPNANVTILADKFYEETLSYGAAGIFRPGGGFSGPSEEITKKWIYDSYNYYERLLYSENADKAGIMQVSGYHFSSEHPWITRNALLEDLLPTYRQVTEEELKICPGEWKYGAFLTTMVIESSRFLPWGLSKFTEAGGLVRRQHIDNFSELEESGGGYDLFINAAGFGSKVLCKDTKLVPMRGQVFKVKAPWIKMFYYGDYDTYIVPGRDTITLGGTRNFESYNEKIDKYDSASIWERCTSLVPSLAKSTVEREWVGLRPYRAQVRCEIEHITVGSSNKVLKVIHNYGHGGYGITSSPGTAIHVVNLIKELQRSK